jgi:hypothetical protein
MDDEATIATPIRFADSVRTWTAQLWVSDGRIHCTNAFGDAFEDAEAVTYIRACLNARKARHA